MNGEQNIHWIWTIIDLPTVDTDRTPAVDLASVL